MKIKNIVACFIMFVPVLLFSGIETTKHNLSVTGPGVIKSSDTSRVCVFCHTPHNSTSVAPLWNRNQNAGYTLYSSTTLISSPGQPDGASKLCLSCHDGTIALGEIVNPGVTFAMLGTPDGKIPPSSRTNLGANLSDDHPVSFVPNISSVEYSNPSIGDSVKLDHSGKLQCTSCHDPHNNTYGKFLTKSNFNSGICKTCHTKTGYSASSHNLSSSTWNGTGTDPWPYSDFTTVSANSCGNCHQPHKAAKQERLLNSNLEENVCFPCHNGNVAGKNIESVFFKTSVHNVSAYTGEHDPTENTNIMSRHVECVDCHNPHVVNSQTATAPNVNGNLKGVSGADLSGNIVSEATYQYQICIKCHGSNVNFNILGPANRATDTTNIRIAINPSNESHHAIAGQGNSNHVPSLLPPYTTSSIIYCSDCHNSDSSVNAGGTGPNGPHGSNYNYLLERNYSTADYTTYSYGAYALCFKCHDPNIVLSRNMSAFKLHYRHVVREDSPCSACHDPHGVPNTNSLDGTNIRLINFDKNIVQPLSDGTLKFEVIGSRGYCYLNCHGERHNPEKYNRQ
jgi:predicted CXXCH cytochrome family protein